MFAHQTKRLLIVFSTYLFKKNIFFVRVQRFFFYLSSSVCSVLMYIYFKFLFLFHIQVLNSFFAFF